METGLLLWEDNYRQATATYYLVLEVRTFALGHLFLRSNYTSDTVGKPVGFPMKQCHICKEIAFMQ